MSENNILVAQETSLLLPSLALFFLPVIFLLTKHLKTSLSKTSPLPPGPFSWPILGNIPQLWNEPLYIFAARFAKTYGSDLMSLKLGTQLVVVGSTRASAIEILKSHDRNLSARYVPHVLPAKSPELNNLSIGWTFECNDSWKSLRTVCRRGLFSSKAIQSQAHIRETRLTEMHGVVSKMQGKEVSIKNVAFASIINMISNILFSKDLVNLEHEILSGEYGGFLVSALELQSMTNMSDLYPILGPLDLQNIRKQFMEIYHTSSMPWGTLITERRERRKAGNPSSQSQDFLDFIIEDGFSDDQIDMLFRELLATGSDSSALTTEWTMAELIENPKCMKLVQEELAREICSQGRSTVVMESDLPKLKYLEACLKEVLRLHPPGPLLVPHRATKSCTVMNYTIPKDSQVLVNAWAIGRDPGYWEDPLAFKPERFLNSSLDFKGNDFEYLPFSSGRRICPGMPMAAKQVPLIVASLIQSFDWSLPHGRDTTDLNKLDMTETYDFLLRKKEPLILIPAAKIYRN